MCKKSNKKSRLHTASFQQTQFIAHQAANKISIATWAAVIKQICGLSVEYLFGLLGHSAGE
jgi:hypothetical protein